MSGYGVIKVTVLTAQHRDGLLDLIQTFENGSCPHQLPSLLSPMLNIHTIVLFLDQHFLNYQTTLFSKTVQQLDNVDFMS